MRSAEDDLAEQLLAVLRPMGRVVVALSGGVDSAVVAYAAHQALGDQALAVTGTSPSLAQRERDDACRLARQIGIRHLLLPTGEFANPRYAANDGTRCYHCKSELYDQLLARRAEWQVDVVLSGANLDDQGDYRPGLRAAAERGVRHPLQEAGFTKAMVRTLAQHWGLPTWDKPASPCLASRLAVGVEATPERVARVEAAESYLRSLGLRDLRVRCHPGEHARVEVLPEDIPRLVDPVIRLELVRQLRGLGFHFVSLDLAGLQSGGLNVLVPEALLQQR